MLQRKIFSFFFFSQLIELFIEPRKKKKKKKKVKLDMRYLDPNL